ncbi:uncharacterized protein LOC142224406 [Haematobia irritans]|uniref:uncharacterized protein LOC142224406 n=1 Tax=Haematobia irritans TaxID=7368 RepID=UPI003F502B44
MLFIKQDWSKSYRVRPRDNLKSHILIDDKFQFKSSCENDGCPTSMKSLLGWEYAHKWLKERDDFQRIRTDRSKPKYIPNDYEKWLQKRKPKNNLMCKIRCI